MEKRKTIEEVCDDLWCDYTHLVLKAYMRLISLNLRLTVFDEDGFDIGLGTIMYGEDILNKILVHLELEECYEFCENIRQLQIEFREKFSEKSKEPRVIARIKQVREEVKKWNEEDFERLILKYDYLFREPL